MLRSVTGMPGSFNRKGLCSFYSLMGWLGGNGLNGSC